MTVAAELIQRVYSLIESMDLPGAAVYLNRAEAIDASECPAVLIEPDSQFDVLDRRMSSGIQERTTAVRIKIYVAGENALQLMDGIRGQVLDALKIGMSDYCHRLTHQSTEYDIDDASPLISLFTDTYQFSYLVEEGSLSKRA